MNHYLAFTVLLLAFASGCATGSGFNRGELRQELSGKTEVTDQEIQKTLTLKPQLPRPFKVGVYFRDPNVVHPNKTQLGTTQWNWSSDDKMKILSLFDPFKSSKQVSDVIQITPVTVAGTDLKSLRLAAAQHGIDALLVVSGVKDSDNYVNHWGWTYIALVPALFVPANEVNVLFMSWAAMWDVRNQYLYLTAEAESLKQQTRPAAFTNERGLTEEAKTDSVEKLREEVVKMMQQLTAKKAP
jgi:hypothetical protein